MDTEKPANDIRNIKHLSTDQVETLNDHGIVFVESLLAAATADPEHLARLLSLDPDDLACVIEEAKNLSGVAGDGFEQSEVPPLGLIAPDERPQADEANDTGVISETDTAQPDDQSEGES